MKNITLLCLPYAGASATIYYKLRPFLQKDINLIPIELSGRGSRFDEKLLYSFNEVVEDVVNQIKSKISKEEKYMILGYSFGSLLAYEASKRLKQKPEHLFLAAFQPPMYEMSSDLLGLEDEKFIQKLVNNGGIEADLTINLDLLKYFIPIMRADFASVESYQFDKSSEKLSCRATILYTAEDEHSDKIHKWNDIFVKACEYKLFTGNHFFIKRDYVRMANIINRVSLRYL
ncbi:hypothetical protein AB685_16850 [Bacillus sp. LL01]|uniref:thioesterase II family protein n=1 Tax=Bacillus sp. LL01 TaxID=1665556 RepID=UPI00064D56AF|nr:thioesterase domain-containing protein [Bacillus sp. LL01]KMJ57656.1 hypothetical protein AB685_16850 [Bacillus sp. LL01]